MSQCCSASRPPHGMRTCFSCMPHIVTSVGPGTIQLWRPSTGKLLAHIRGGCGLILALGEGVSPLVIQLSITKYQISVQFHHPVHIHGLISSFHPSAHDLYEDCVIVCIHDPMISCMVWCSLLVHRSVVLHSLSGYDGRTVDICVFQWTCYSQLLAQ